MTPIPLLQLSLLLTLSICRLAASETTPAPSPVRVFIFAGQSNMVGSDSRVDDIQRFPPFSGLENPQPNVRFAYTIGREDKFTSDGWVDLQPVNNTVGPELSFAQKVSQATGAPVAIIKCAAGGTHLGGDWNPETPSGFKLYPLALDLVRSALADLDRQGIPYRLEGFMWHQGENDMFEQSYMDNYGPNLRNFIASWRRDLNAPDLRYYIGELCTKTIWGMDLRPRMYAISLGQKSVTNTDPLTDYVPTSHVGVEIGGGVGLHYHYGTLGQLEHGVNYADAYLHHQGIATTPSRPLPTWPYPANSRVKLFILAGHRNMEGERAFIQDLEQDEKLRPLAQDNPAIAFQYSLGGGYRQSTNWEPLGPTGFYDTFGPELSFGHTLQTQTSHPFALAKFTHSGSQVIDWTPAGSEAKTRNLYPTFIAFIQNTIQDLENRGHSVDLAGVFYHLGENDMSFGPFRQNAIPHLQSLISQSRQDLELPHLKWFVSQQPPTRDESVDNIHVTEELAALAKSDPDTIHIQALTLPPEPEQLVITSQGIVELGRLLAQAYLNTR
jgi:hypothetical protein